MSPETQEQTKSLVFSLRVAESLIQRIAEVFGSKTRIEVEKNGIYKDYMALDPQNIYSRMDGYSQGGNIYSFRIHFQASEQQRWQIRERLGRMTFLTVGNSLQSIFDLQMARQNIQV